MDTRDYFFSVIQDRTVPVRLRCQKLLACAHDFQLSLDKNELFQWEEIRKRHQKSGMGSEFQTHIRKWCHSRVEVSPAARAFNSDAASGPDAWAFSSEAASGRELLDLSMQIWKSIIPQMEVLRPGWHDFLRDTLSPLYTSCKNNAELLELYDAFAADYPDWAIQEEQLLLYWIYTYFCGAVYDDQIFAKVKMAVVCTFMIHALAVGTYLKNGRHFSFEELVSISYRISRELEHSDPNLNEFENLMDKENIFKFENFML